MPSRLAAAVLLQLAALASAAAVKRDSPDISLFTSSPVDFLYPTGRTGFNATLASREACGAAAASSTRADFPVSGGQLSIQALGVAANVDLLYVDAAAPTAYHQFSTYTDTVLDMTPGGYCVSAPDFTSLDVAAGTDVTFLVFYQLYGDETEYYQCADVTLVDAGSYTAPSYTCANSSSVLNVATAGTTLDDANEASGSVVDGQTVVIYATASGAAAAAAATATVTVAAGSSGLSAVAGGGIGAAVTLAVAAALLVLGSVAGCVRIGRRRRIAINDASSIASTYPLQKVRYEFDGHEGPAA